MTRDSSSAGETTGLSTMGVGAAFLVVSLFVDWWAIVISVDITDRVPLNEMGPFNPPSGAGLAVGLFTILAVALALVTFVVSFRAVRDSDGSLERRAKLPSLLTGLAALGAVLFALGFPQAYPGDVDSFAGTQTFGGDPEFPADDPETARWGPGLGWGLALFGALLVPGGWFILGRSAKRKPAR